MELSKCIIINDEFKCEICEKSVSTVPCEDKHVSVIHKQCKTCGKSFSRSGELKKHIKTIHEGQRNYKCDFCGKSFTTSGHLKRHIKTIHKGQRNYQGTKTKSMADTSN